MATAEVDRRCQVNNVWSGPCDFRSVPLLLSSINSSRSQAAIEAAPLLFCAEDYLFESHGIIMGLHRVPQQLLESDFQQLYSGISSSKEFKDAPLPVKAVSLVERLLPLVGTPPSYAAVYVITTSSNVKYMQEVLRCYYYHPHKLVGNLPDHKWMHNCLDIIVTSPEQLYSLGNLSSYSVTALVLVDDGSQEYLTQVLELLERFHDIHASLPLFLRPPALRPHKKWKKSPRAYDQMDDELRFVIEHNLPVVSCPGLLDYYFFETVDLFAVFERNVISQDSSAMLAFMPGLIPDAGSNVSLLVAPGARVPQLAEVLRVFLERLGLFELRVVCLCGNGSKEAMTAEVGNGDFCIFVGTPDRIEVEMLKPGRTRWKPCKVAVVEADVLMSSGLKVQVRKVLSRGAENMTVAIHSAELTRDVEELIAGFCRGDPTRPRRIPRAATGLAGVEHLYVLAREAKKVNKLSQICRLWMEIFQQKPWRVIAVYCSSASEVKLLRSNMESVMASWPKRIARFALAATHTDMEAEMVEAIEQELPRGRVLLITNIYSFRWGDVISFNMPENAEEYSCRAATDRNLNSKRVISICSREEVSTLKQWGEALGFEAKLVPES